MTIRSKAGLVLATSEDPDARSIAAHILSAEPPAQTVKSTEDLERILKKTGDKEGYKDLAQAIRAELALRETQT